jgi:hypothetical protein
MMQSSTNCSPPWKNSLISREKTGNFAILGQLRQILTGKNPSGSGAFRHIPCSILAGNFFEGAGNFVPCLARMQGNLQVGS